MGKMRENGAGYLTIKTRAVCIKIKSQETHSMRLRFLKLK